MRQTMGSGSIGSIDQVLTSHNKIHGQHKGGGGGGGVGSASKKNNGI